MSAYASRVRLYGAQFEDSFLTHSQIFHIATLLSAREDFPRTARFHALEWWAHMNLFGIDELIAELKRLKLIDDDLIFDDMRRNDLV